MFNFFFLISLTESFESPYPIGKPVINKEICIYTSSLEIECQDFDSKFELTDFMENAGSYDLYDGKNNSEHFLNLTIYYTGFKNIEGCQGDKDFGGKINVIGKHFSISFNCTETASHKTPNQRYTSLINSYGYDAIYNGFIVVIQSNSEYNFNIFDVGDSYLISNVGPVSKITMSGFRGNAHHLSWFNIVQSEKLYFLEFIDEPKDIDDQYKYIDREIVNIIKGNSYLDQMYSPIIIRNVNSYSSLDIDEAVTTDLFESEKDKSRFLYTLTTFYGITLNIYTETDLRDKTSGVSFPYDRSVENSEFIFGNKVGETYPTLTYNRTGTVDKEKQANRVILLKASVQDAEMHIKYNVKPSEDISDTSYLLIKCETYRPKIVTEGDCYAIIENNNKGAILFVPENKDTENGIKVINIYKLQYGEFAYGHSNAILIDYGNPSESQQKVKLVIQNYICDFYPYDTRIPSQTQPRVPVPQGLFNTYQIYPVIKWNTINNGYYNVDPVALELNNVKFTHITTKDIGDKLNNIYPMRFFVYHGEGSPQFPSFTINGLQSPESNKDIKVVVDFCFIGDEGKYLTEEQFDKFKKVFNGKYVLRQIHLTTNDIANKKGLAIAGDTSGNNKDNIILPPIHNQPGFWKEQSCFRFKTKYERTSPGLNDFEALITYNENEFYTCSNDRTLLTNKVCFASPWNIDKCEYGSATIDVSYQFYSDVLNYEKVYKTTPDMNGVKIQILYEQGTFDQLVESKVIDSIPVFDLSQFNSEHQSNTILSDKYLEFKFDLPIEIVSDSTIYGPINLSNFDRLTKSPTIEYVTIVKPLPSDLRCDIVTYDCKFTYDQTNVVNSERFSSGTRFSRLISSYIRVDDDTKTNRLKFDGGTLIIYDMEGLSEIRYVDGSTTFIFVDDLRNYQIYVDAKKIMFDANKLEYPSKNKLQIISDVKTVNEIDFYASIGFINFNGNVEFKVSDGCLPFKEFLTDTDTPYLSFEKSRSITCHFNHISIPFISFDIETNIIISPDVLASYSNEQFELDFGGITQPITVKLDQFSILQKEDKKKVGIIAKPLDKVKIQINNLEIGINSEAEFSNLEVLNSLVMRAGSLLRPSSLGTNEFCNILGKNVDIYYNAEIKPGIIEFSKRCSETYETVEKINIRYDDTISLNPMDTNKFKTNYITSDANIFNNMKTTTCESLKDNNKIIMYNSTSENWKLNNPTMSFECSSSSSTTSLKCKTINGEESIKAALKNEDVKPPATAVENYLGDVSSNGVATAIAVFAVFVVIAVIIWVVMSMKFGSTIHQSGSKNLSGSGSDSVSGYGSDSLSEGF